MKNIQVVALAFIVGTGFLILEARVRKLEADAMERSAASSLEYRRAQIRRLVNSQFPESIEIYRSLLARGTEIIRVERTSPETCAVTARADGKLETFYGIRGTQPEEPAPGARPGDGALGSASTEKERSAASRPEAPPR